MPQSADHGAARRQRLGHRRHKKWIGNGGIVDVHVVNAAVDQELGQFDRVRVAEGNLLAGQDKLEHKLAKAREVVLGAKRSGSATLGTLEQTLGGWSMRRLPRKAGFAEPLMRVAVQPTAAT